MFLFDYIIYAIYDCKYKTYSGDYVKTSHKVSFLCKQIIPQDKIKILWKTATTNPNVFVQNGALVIRFKVVIKTSSTASSTYFLDFMRKVLINKQYDRIDEKNIFPPSTGDVQHRGRFCVLFDISNNAKTYPCQSTQLSNRNPFFSELSQKFISFGNF